MAKFTKKITNLINQQVPEFVLSDHPKFLEFVKSYYKFMESAEITLANIELTDGIQLETETAQTNNLILMVNYYNYNKSMYNVYKYCTFSFTYKIAIERENS